MTTEIGRVKCSISTERLRQKEVLGRETGMVYNVKTTTTTCSACQQTESVCLPVCPVLSLLLFLCSCSSVGCLRNILVWNRSRPYVHCVYSDVWRLVAGSAKAYLVSVLRAKHNNNQRLGPAGRFHPRTPKFYDFRNASSTNNAFLQNATFWCLWSWTSDLKED